MSKTNGKIEYEIRRGLKNRVVFTVDSIVVGSGHNPTIYSQKLELHIGKYCIIDASCLYCACVDSMLKICSWSTKLL